MFQQFNITTGGEIFNLFFKVFSTVFSLLYLIYGLVIYKQTQVMTKSLVTKTNPLILFISLLQIIFGLILFFVSLLII